MTGEQASPTELPSDNIVLRDHVSVQQMYDRLLLRRYHYFRFDPGEGGGGDLPSRFSVTLICNQSYHFRISNIYITLPPFLNILKLSLLI